MRYLILLLCCCAGCSTSTICVTNYDHTPATGVEVEVETQLGSFTGITDENGECRVYFPAQYARVYFYKPEIDSCCHKSFNYKKRIEMRFSKFFGWR